MTDMREDEFQIRRGGVVFPPPPAKLPWRSGPLLPARDLGGHRHETHVWLGVDDVRERIDGYFAGKRVEIIAPHTPESARAKAHALLAAADAAEAKTSPASQLAALIQCARALAFTYAGTKRPPETKPEKRALWDAMHAAYSALGVLDTRDLTDPIRNPDSESRRP